MFAFMFSFSKLVLDLGCLSSLLRGEIVLLIVLVLKLFWESGILDVFDVD